MTAPVADTASASTMHPCPTDSVSESTGVEATTDAAHVDMVHSMRNAAKLGMSLVLTWAVALGVRLVLPRHLGPEAFGVFQFADAITTTLFVLLGLGLETYIRKEVSTHRGQAGDFLGGVHLLRLVAGSVLAVGLVAVLSHAGKPPSVQRLVLVMCLAQLLVAANATYAALLHAAGTVSGLSVLNVMSKFLWGGGIFAAFVIGKRVEYVAWAMVASEAVKAVALHVLSRRHLGVRMSVDLRGTRAVLVASLPFFVASVVQAAFAKIDLTVLSFLTTDLEVGWYAAASNLAGLTMIITPLIGWVLLPLVSRAADRSEHELFTLIRRAMELVIAASIPISLLLYLGADVIVGTVFGAAFAPATLSLKTLAPMFVLTYVAIISSITLIRQDRGWTLTMVSVIGLVASPALNWVAVPWFSTLLGPGGAGVGAATVLVFLETVMTVILTVMVARSTFDRRTGTMIAKTLVICATVIALDHMLLSFGAVRLVADTALYIGLVVAVKAVDIPEIIRFVRRAAAYRGESNEKYV